VGQLAVEQGTLSLDNGLANAGIVSVADAAALRVTGGGMNLVGNSEFAGSGLVEIPSGNVSLEGTYRGRLLVSGGVVSGNSVLEGVLDWTGGTLTSGSLRVATNGTVHLSGDADKVFTSFVFNNAGQVTWTGGGRLVGQFTGYGQSVLFTNLPGGLFRIQNDTNLVLSTPGHGGETMVLHNAGTLVKTGGTGVTTFEGVPALNTGLIDVQIGAIDFRAGLVNEGEVRGGGKVAPAGSAIPGNEAFALSIAGVPGLNYRIEYTSDLDQWQTLLVTNAPSAVFPVVDPNAPDKQLRYYRAIVVR